MSVPVLCELPLRLRGLSPDPAGETGLRPAAGPGTGGGVCDRDDMAVGLGFHEERWNDFFFRTLALYAARIAAVASFVMLNTLAEVEGAFDATLWGRDCGSSRRGGNEPCIDGEAGGDAAAGSKTGEKVGEGSDDSQLSYWLGVDEEEEVLGATLDNRW